MKWIVIALVLVCMARTCGAAWSTDWPLDPTNMPSLSLRYFQDLVNGCNERCRATWYQEQGGTNYYRVNPIRITYTVQVSTGLYISGYSTNAFVEYTNGVPYTNLYVFTNWAVATTNATCTNFDCYGPSGVFTNPGISTKAIVDAVDSNIYALFAYYVAGTVANHVVSFDYSAWWNDAYSANTNKLPETVNTYANNYPPKWAVETSPTNWAGRAGFGEIIYPHDTDAKYGSLLAYPFRLATNYLLGEYRFVVTNTYTTTSGVDLIENRQIGVKWVDWQAYPISNAPSAVWSNPCDFAAEFYNPVTNPASSSFIMYYQGWARAWDNHVYQSTNQPRTYAQNDAQPRSISGTDTWYTIGGVEPFDIVSASGTINRTETDASAGTIIGSAFRLWFTNKASLYGLGVSQGLGTIGATTPWIPTPELMNERYYAINALRYRAYPATIYTGQVYAGSGGDLGGCTATSAALAQASATAGWTNSGMSYDLGGYAQLRATCGECWEATLLHYGSKLSSTVTPALTNVAKSLKLYVTAVAAGTGTNDSFGTAGDSISEGLNLVETVAQSASDTNAVIYGTSYVGDATAIPAWPTTPSVPDCSNIYGAVKGWIEQAPPSQLGGVGVGVVDFTFEYRNW